MYTAKKRAATRRASRGYAYVTEKREGLTANSLYHIIKAIVKPIFIIFLAFIITSGVISAFAIKHPDLRAIEHKVTYGDSLWSIAQDYKPDGMSMGDYMDWVYRHNESSMIYPGDVVVMGITK